MNVATTWVALEHARRLGENSVRGCEPTYWRAVLCPVCGEPEVDYEANTFVCGFSASAYLVKSRCAARPGCDCDVGTLMNFGCVCRKSP